MMPATRTNKDQKVCQRGSVTILFIISLLAFISMGTLAVDMAHLYHVKGELQNTADSAALSGVSGLGLGTSEARKRAQDVAAENQVAGDFFGVDDADIEYGVWDYSTRTFTPDAALPNSIRVATRKTNSSPYGAAKMIFGRLFGKEEADIVTHATAVINSRDIILVLDRSGSMGWEGGTKLTGLKNGAHAFVNHMINQPLTEDKVGIVWYNNNAQLVSPLTDNLALLHTMIDSVSASGYTSISEGINAALQELSSIRANPHNQHVIIVMTDGLANTCIPLPAVPNWLEGPGWHGSGGGGCCVSGDSIPWNEASYWSNSRAKREVMYLTKEVAVPGGIIIYTITLGTAPNIDDVLMREVADASNGLYYTTDDPNNMTAIFLDIANKINISLVR